MPHSTIARSIRHHRAVQGYPYKGVPSRTAQRVSAAHTGLRYGEHTPQKDSTALRYSENTDFSHGKAYLRIADDTL